MPWVQLPSTNSPSDGVLGVTLKACVISSLLHSCNGTVWFKIIHCYTERY